MTALTKTETALTPVGAAIPGIDPKDIIIPRIMIAQALSESVADGQVSVGTVYRSTTKEVLADKTKKFQFIPLTNWRTWRISEQVGGKFEFRRREPLTTDNLDMEWQEKGTLWRRDRESNFYVLLVDDIAKEKAAMEAVANGEMPNPDDALLPSIISFTRTSSEAGRILATHFLKSAHFRLNAYVSVFEMGIEQVKNDKGIFYVFRLDAKSLRRSTADEMDVAQNWVRIIGDNDMRIDEEERTHRVAPEPVSAPVAAEPIDDGAF